MIQCEERFFGNWAKTTKKVMWGQKNSSQPRGWEYSQKWCHPESLLSLERLEEGAIYRSSKVAKSIVFNEVPVTSFKVRSFWECFICYILTMHAYIHHVFVVCIICGFFVYIFKIIQVHLLDHTCPAFVLFFRRMVRLRQPSKRTRRAAFWRRCSEHFELHQWKIILSTCESWEYLGGSSFSGTRVIRWLNATEQRACIIFAYFCFDSQERFEID